MTSHAPHIAVVSLAGIFPGAPDAQRFITQILNKQQHIIQIPQNRWVAPKEKMVTASPAPDRAVSDRAGLITDFSFDATGLDLDETLLSGLDPVHHLVLSAGRTACRSCHLPQNLKQRTGVILAAIALPTDTASDFSRDLLCHRTPGTTKPSDALACAMVSGPAAVLARALNLKAGSFTLDAACASSLVAVKLACEQLLTGRADVMVTGGVSRPDSLYTQIGFTQLAALSPSGRCAPFDRLADGLVVGEGCGILVLKRLDDALACGDSIHGVITGWGISNDIDGNLVAPASEGQVRAMAAAYKMAGLSPARFQYMECHGSGTPVGDKVELRSIRTLLETYDCLDSPLAIGSVKSNIGHLLTAAGAAGIIKTLLAMNRESLPPSCNFTALPDRHPLEGTQVQVQSRAADWPLQESGEPRRAAISAFGFGGINAHILVEACPGSRSYPVTSDISTFHPSSTAVARPKAPDRFAIVGMGVLTGDCADLNQFTGRILGRTLPALTPAITRWRRTDHLSADLAEIKAGFLNSLSVTMDEFHIPPVQIPDILPQHLVLLKAAKGALIDAGIPPRPGTAEGSRTRAGCAVGIDFDFGAADFSLRWYAHDLDDPRQDRLSPPLTFNRTLGALGGIAASRLAREFKLGGPCFTVSADAASGMKTLEVGTRSLAAGETDWFICASVDMAGDIRSFCLNQPHVPANWARPAEGAAAIVIKRLADAAKSKDRIYAVIEGVSGGSGGPVMDDQDSAQSCYPSSLARGLDNAGVPFSSIGFFTTHSGGHGPSGAAEARALAALIRKPADVQCVLGWTAGTMGDTRGVSGLLSVMHSAVCLYHRVFSGFRPGAELLNLKHGGFVMPETAAPWPDTPAGIRRAGAAAMTRDGAAAFCLLAQAPDSSFPPTRSAAPLRAPEFSGNPDTINIPTTQPPIPEDLITLLNSQAGSDPLMPHANPFSMPCSRPVAVNPETLAAASDITARAHEKFLALSRTHMDLMQAQFAALTRAAAAVTRKHRSNPPWRESPDLPPISDPPLFTRDQCMEFAVGRAGRVLGPDFDIIDTYPVRVRLPGDPLMLVDRILAIEGTPCSLGPGKIITQHDVRPDAWYLDGGMAPVSISIEAGQADLFLCAYLGIDHAVKGQRRYRLLDAKVTFHRALPKPGETIEYHICIDRFLRQGEVFLFFFHYKGYIGSQLFISMRDGCAGFFTEEEVENSGGIVLKNQDREPVRTDIQSDSRHKSRSNSRFEPLVPVQPTSFHDDQIRHLRDGNLAAAFGSDFKGITLGKAQRLPGGRMHLIDRVLSFDPKGGRYGLGTIVAEADIKPDAWFLTCHFTDDPVMPGTLMYECCAHALRIFVQCMGWVTPNPLARFDVLQDNESDLKCRGPVTPATRKARYEIEIKQIGYTAAAGQPFVIADAHMFADDLHIVLYKDMGMILTGVSLDKLRHLWRHK
ncbi:MAG: beta-ketoacyl synthase N-terminal-like domain-containing protein [Desulfotignum sp.]|nr:beta-ketoacyl synthase N-terminal-like domain-containing protein [Desulfotignum sp.]